WGVRTMGCRRAPLYFVRYKVDVVMEISYSGTESLGCRIVLSTHRMDVAARVSALVLDITHTLK
ncbi:MAG TPA: hypothetical protein V6D19_11095, partial [Stenomitos sp.]